MNEAGFFETKRFSPTSLTLIIALHAAALTAAMAWRMDVIITKHPPTQVTFIDLPKNPPPDTQETKARPTRDVVYVPPNSTTPVRQEDPIVLDSTTDPPPIDPPKWVEIPRDPPLSDSPQVVQSARAKGDVRSLLTTSDYPEIARQRGEGGTVKARLEIGASGRVTGCSIVTSSGSTTLDSATCRVLRERAHFTPAKDSSGQPVSDSYVTPRIIWKIEGNG